MYSRHITMQVKQNMLPKFPEVIENEIPPPQAEGFPEEIIWTAPNETEWSRSACGRKRIADNQTRESIRSREDRKPVRQGLADSEDIESGA